MVSSGKFSVNFFFLSQRDPVSAVEFELRSACVHSCSHGLLLKSTGSSIDHGENLRSVLNVCLWSVLRAWAGNPTSKTQCDSSPTKKKAQTEGPLASFGSRTFCSSQEIVHSPVSASVFSPEAVLYSCLYSSRQGGRVMSEKECGASPVCNLIVVLHNTK